MESLDMIETQINAASMAAEVSRLTGMQAIAYGVRVDPVALQPIDLGMHGMTDVACVVSFRFADAPQHRFYLMRGTIDGKIAAFVQSHQGFLVCPMPDGAGHKSGYFPLEAWEFDTEEEAKRNFGKMLNELADLVHNAMIRTRSSSLSDLLDSSFEASEQAYTETMENPDAK